MKRLSAMVMVMGCSGAPARAPGAPPDLLVVVLPPSWPVAPPAELAPHVAHYAQSQAIHTEPVPALRALLTGQWPGTTASSTPNTLHGVLKLYGYRTVGSLPAAHVPAGTPWLAAGLDATPFSGRTCLADQLDTLSGLHPGPSDKALAAVLVAEEAGCDPTKDRAALAAMVTGTRKDHLVTVVTGLVHEDWRDPTGGPVPLFLAGPSIPAGPLEGYASVVDLVPTLLPLADAVVPSDAIGTGLFGDGAPKAGPELVFQQNGHGNVGIRTPQHLFYVVEGTEPLPAQRTPALSVAYIPLHGNTDPLDAVQEPLYAALVQWDRQRRATSAADRMGSGAFREMLRDQGYWH